MENKLYLLRKKILHREVSLLNNVDHLFNISIIIVLIINTSILEQIMWRYY